jgi:hypothetical protein
MFTFQISWILIIPFKIFKTCTNFLQIYLVSVLSKFVRYLKRFFQNLFSNKDIFTSSSYVKYRTGLIIYAIFQNFYTYYGGSWKLRLGPYNHLMDHEMKKTVLNYLDNFYLFFMQQNLTGAVVGRLVQSESIRWPYGPNWSLHLLVKYNLYIIRAKFFRILCDKNIF